MSLTNTVTEAMNAGRYVYDIELSSLDSATSTTVVERILQGNLTVNPSVT